MLIAIVKINVDDIIKYHVHRDSHDIRDSYVRTIMYSYSRGKGEALVISLFVLSQYDTIHYPYIVFLTLRSTQT
jgi:hypothetical protein